MSLPASDAFTEASDTALASHTAGGITWVVNVGTFTVLGASDTVRHNSASTEGAAHDSTNTYNNDQKAQTKMVTRATNPAGPAVRVASGTTQTYYGYYADSTASYLFKNVSGVWTQIGSNGAAGANGSTYALEVSGTTLTPKKDGATADIGAQTSSSISSGYAGICGYGSTSSQIDNFAADNMTVVTKAKPIYQRHTLYVWRSR